MRKIIGILVLFAMLCTNGITRASDVFEMPPLPLAGNGLADGNYIKDALDAANLGVEAVFTYLPQNVYKIYTQEGFITDIRLEPREKINYIGGGDTLRWKIDTADSADNSHVFIKPMQQGISTNLVITTDRRIYQIILESGRMYNPIVSWKFPKSGVFVQKEENVNDHAAINPLDMNFNYRISEKAYKWSPESVFRSGHKTYFRMKRQISDSELPAFFEIAEDNERVLVSYRYLNGYFIVDKIIDKGVFILGKKEVKVSFKG